MKIPRYVFLLMGLVFLSVLWWVSENKTDYPTFEQNSEPTQAVEYVNTPSSDMTNHMEYIGCDKNSDFVSKVTFYYYRDIITDQMFLISFDSKGHSVTPMSNPETGLPLTYAQYQAMKDANLQMEGELTVESNE